MAEAGTITHMSVTPANVDERHALWDIAQKIKGMLIGDKGYIDKDLQTPLRDNMTD